MFLQFILRRTNALLSNHLPPKVWHLLDLYAKVFFFGSCFNFLAEEIILLYKNLSVYLIVYYTKFKHKLELFSCAQGNLLL